MVKGQQNKRTDWQIGLSALLVTNRAVRVAYGDISARFCFSHFFLLFFVFSEEVKPAPYEWNQTLKEVCLTVPLPEGCTKRQIVVTFKPDHLKIVLKGATVVDGALHKRIKVRVGVEVVCVLRRGIRLRILRGIWKMESFV
jgi:hypothetical protein